MACLTKHVRLHMSGDDTV